MDILRTLARRAYGPTKRHPDEIKPGERIVCEEAEDETETRCVWNIETRVERAAAAL